MQQVAVSQSNFSSWSVSQWEKRWLQLNTRHSPWSPQSTSSCRSLHISSLEMIIILHYFIHWSASMISEWSDVGQWSTPLDKRSNWINIVHNWTITLDNGDNWTITLDNGVIMYIFPLNITFFIRPSTVCVWMRVNLMKKREGLNVLYSCCLINHCITSDMCNNVVCEWRKHFLFSSKNSLQFIISVRRNRWEPYWCSIRWQHKHWSEMLEHAQLDDNTTDECNGDWHGNSQKCFSPITYLTPPLAVN